MGCPFKQEPKCQRGTYYHAMKVNIKYLNVLVSVSHTSHMIIRPAELLGCSVLVLCPIIQRAFLNTMFANALSSLKPTVPPPRLPTPKSGV